jgi:uncharacterized protein YodC (DUF2158 family)
MADDFQAGDTVQLKSGGPIMTIEKIGKLMSTDVHNSALCTWFGEKNKKETSWFPLPTLKKVDTHSGVF